MRSPRSAPVRLTSILVAAAVAACGGGGSAKPTTPERDPAATKQPEPELTRGDGPDKDVEAAPVETPRTREQIIADALARVPAIREAVGKLRGLASKDVVASTQTVEDFEVFVRAEMAAGMPAEKAAAESKALAHLGVLEQPVDLIGANIDAAVSQVAAYYNPKTDQFAVVQIPEDDGQFDMVSSHELMHAIQDQNFDLEAFLPPTLAEEEVSARRFLVEGEATLMMLIYVAVAQGLQDPFDPKVLAMMRAQIEMLAGLDVAQIAAMMGGPAAAAAAAVPPYVMTPMIDAYMKGARTVLMRYLEGGWAAVDALYATPPTTTEQVLHPASKLICRREAPIALTLPAATAGKGAVSVAEGTLGELGFRVYGEVWKLQNDDDFAAGWAGDRWQVVEQDGALLGMIATAWDSAEDATQFAEGMKASFVTRAVKADLRVSGDRVDVVIGCDGKACKKPLDAMAKLQKKVKTPKAVAATAEETECMKRLGP